MQFKGGCNVLYIFNMCYKVYTPFNFVSVRIKWFKCNARKRGMQNETLSLLFQSTLITLKASNSIKLTQS